MLASGLTAASKYYISHSKPYSPPPPRSPASGSGASSPQPPPSPNSATPHPYLSKAHAWSGTAAKASARTSDLVGNIIKSAVGGKNTDPPPPISPLSQAPRPPVRDYKVYTPKPRSDPTSPTGPPPLPSRNLNVSGSGTSTPGVTPSPPPGDGKRKPLKMYHKVAIGANLVLATLDDSTARLFEAGSQNLSAVVGHKSVVLSLRKESFGLTAFM